jgi:cellulose biosynthesis protein BcsQ
LTKIVSVFNHKGGVSKTTTAFHIGWMLARLGHKVVLVDADPQCNLTGVTLGLVNSWPPPEDDDIAPSADRDDPDSTDYSGAQDRVRGFFENNLDRTLYGALRPAFESEPRMLEAVECFPVDGCEGLYLLPGHLRLGEYEVSLGIAQELSSSLLALKNVPGSVNYMLRITAEAYDADYVIVDMSPSLGALNQNLVATSDLLFLPASPDFFSIMALQSLARVVPRWNRWAENASNNEILAEATYPFPKPRLKFAGALIQRYRLYRAPTLENPYGDPTKPFQDWIERVTASVNEELVPALAKAGLTFTDNEYAEAGIERHILGLVHEFNSLLPKSQEHRVPVYELTKEQLGWAGTVLENSMERVSSLNRVFRDIATRLNSLPHA